jgi:hypothetical protein
MKFKKIFSSETTVDLIDILTLITKDRARTPLKPRKGEGDE